MLEPGLITPLAPLAPKRVTARLPTPSSKPLPVPPPRRVPSAPRPACKSEVALLDPNPLVWLRRALLRLPLG